MKPKIGIIGKGTVGSALKRGLERAGYEVRAVGKDPQGIRDTAVWGDIVILAVPYTATDATLGVLGERANGKPLVDVTNPLNVHMELDLGFTTSAAEELQKKTPRANVVKAFNTIFSTHMDTGRVKGEPIATFVAGDDAQAKEQVLQLARDIGFDAVDSGPLRNARWLEALAYLTILLGYPLKMGTQFGFKLIR